MAPIATTDYPRKACEESFIKKSSLFNTFWAVIAIAITIICVSVAWAIKVSVDIDHLKTTQERQAEQLEKLVRVYNDVDTVKLLLRDENRRIYIAQIKAGQAKAGQYPQ